LAREPLPVVAVEVSPLPACIALPAVELVCAPAMTGISVSQNTVLDVNDWWIFLNIKFDKNIFLRFF
jgi:hypothetical protein